jgi:YD repeat-containing protein
LVRVSDKRWAIISLIASGFIEANNDYRNDSRTISATTGVWSTSYSYDGDGNPITITDSMNRVTPFTDYDSIGSIKPAFRPDNSGLHYDYDPNGNLTLCYTARQLDNLFSPIIVSTNVRPSAKGIPTAWFPDLCIQRSI